MFGFHFFYYIYSLFLVSLLVCLRRCEEFRQNRMKSIDRFAVEDPRTPDQIKEEEEITKRLKQAYKLAKLNAAKKKEKDKIGGLKKHDEYGGGDQDEDEGEKHLGGSQGKLSARSGQSSGRAEKESKGLITPKKQGLPQETIKEGEHEDEDAENEDEEDHFGSDDEEEVDPEEAAIKAAFDDFSSLSNLEGFTADVIPISLIQEAFIRICNQFVSQEIIDKAVLDTDEVDMNLEEYTFPEFRLVFKRYPFLICLLYFLFF
jgi:hypothetical protein